MLENVKFIPILMVVLLMTILCLTIGIDLKTSYKQLCQENRRLMGYVLQTLTVKSQLSCFKECEITKECKSVNILKEERKRFSCELNSCFKMNCEDLDMTTNQYKYFYNTENNVLSFTCNTPADPWNTPVGWTGSCPAVYYNFESLTPGSLTISLPNGGTHSTAVGYGSTKGIALDRDNLEYIDLGTWDTSIACIVRPEECSLGFTLMMKLKLPIACNSRENGFLSTVDTTGRQGFKIPCAIWGYPNHKIGFYVLFSTGETYALGSSTYSPIGSWFTLVVVFDKVAGTLSAYRDGESLGQVTATMGGGTGMNGRKLVLGRGWSVASDKYTSAVYDDLTIWNKPLSPCEVALLN